MGKINYEEGSCFVFPLGKGGFARGVVARMNKKGGVFGYFFGPRLETSNANFDGLEPGNAILRADFGDLGLLQGRWIVYGQLPNWHRSEWPMPPMIRVDKPAGRAWLIWYDEDTFKRLKEIEVDTSQAKMYPAEGVYGYIAIETAISNLLV